MSMIARAWSLDSVRRLGKSTEVKRSWAESGFTVGLSLKNQGREIRIKMELGSNEAIKHAVASGLGISILSRHTMSLGIQSGPLVELDVEGFPISWPWYIGYPAGKRLSVVAKTFLDFVASDAARIDTTEILTTAAV